MLLGVLACGSDETEDETASVGRSSFEVLRFETMTLTLGTQLLRGEPGPAAQIGGELFVPASEAERLPAIILMHGRSGVQEYQRQWARELNQLGIATFLVDSLSGRGLLIVSGWARIIDAYRALAVLAQHPRIDASRIALLGWSQGGIVSFYAGMSRLQRMYQPAGVAFAAYVAFYPGCNYTLQEEDLRDERPVLILHGTADNLTPIAACREDVARLQQAGHQEVELVEFPGAHHAFDSPESTTPTLILSPVYPPGRSTAGCNFIELPDGQLVNQDTGQPFQETDACVSCDGVVAGNLQARNQAYGAMTAFLQEVFGLQP
jgi:dienelactone hydrolase